MAQAQEAPQVGEVERIRAAALRAELPDESLAPVLAGLSRLKTEGLPTAFFVDRVVECISKRARPDRLRNRAQLLEQATRDARDLLVALKARGLSPPPVPPAQWNPVEDLADALLSFPLKAEDVLGVRKDLKSESLPRILAGTDSMAHLMRMELGPPLVHKLLAAIPVSCGEEEIRTLPSALFTGRRCGMEDEAIVEDLVEALASGTLPSQVVKKWSESPSFRRGRYGNPDGSPGGGRGMGPGRGHGRGKGQGRGGGWGPGGG